MDNDRALTQKFRDNLEKYLDEIKVNALSDLKSPNYY